MKARQAAWFAMLQLTLCGFSSEAPASSGNPIQHLAWQPKTEVLEYHACGAADACWVAELKNRKTKKRIAVLHCDGEKLLSGVGKRAETVAAPDCHGFEGEDKFQQIPAALRTMLQR